MDTAAGKNGEHGKRVSFTGLFRYADGMDLLLMLVGMAGALGNGLVRPHRRVRQRYHGQRPQPRQQGRSKLCLLGHRNSSSLLPDFLQLACWTITGERQATRIRSLYLKSVLRQDISFFDVEMTTGQIVSRMTGDTMLLQDAIGEKVGKSLQLVATFIGGFVVAFFKGWLLSLVMLACIPPVAIAGGAVAKVLSKITSKVQASYTDAGNVVEEAIGAIKTVATFNGEKHAIRAYNKLIHTAYKTNVQEGLANGFGMGSVFFITFCSYGLALWYGSKLVLTKGYTGGQVITILFDIMIGAIMFSNLGAERYIYGYISVVTMNSARIGVHFAGRHPCA